MNKWNGIGRITKDIELKSGNSGMSYCGFTVAINREYTKQGEEKQADFITCKAFGKTAEFVSKYFSKGKLIAITGRIQTGSYEKDGVKHYTSDVMVEKVYFCGDSGKKQEETQLGGFVPIEANDEELPF